MTMTDTDTRPAIDAGKARLLHTMIRTLQRWVFAS